MTESDNFTPITVVDWISYEDAESHTDLIGGLGGWFKEGDTWDDYLASCNETSAIYAKAIRDDVLASGRYIAGDTHQNADDGVPLFSDDTVGCFSYRGWGDLMAAIANAHDGKDHCYMDFYMEAW